MLWQRVIDKQLAREQHLLLETGNAQKTFAWGSTAAMCNADIVHIKSITSLVLEYLSDGFGLNWGASETHQ